MLVAGGGLSKEERIFDSVDLRESCSVAIVAVATSCMIERYSASAGVNSVIAVLPVRMRDRTDKTCSEIELSAVVGAKEYSTSLSTA